MSEFKGLTSKQAEEKLLFYNNACKCLNGAKTIEDFRTASQMFEKIIEKKDRTLGYLKKTEEKHGQSGKCKQCTTAGFE